MQNWMLPRNRSEQYYTATIFPMLVAGDNFRRFQAFANLLTGIVVPPLSLDPEPNFQFYTEFSLRKALIGDARQRFADAPTGGDTPDIVILIDGVDQRVLIVLEGKMYSPSTKMDLLRQMGISPGKSRLLHHGAQSRSRWSGLAS
ncbi:MAG: hypothetical protein H0U74_01140 [Bradymonadaceae bacterium]|nr:hypothetical protein [Lujinxingiaceae bacterium]